MINPMIEGELKARFSFASRGVVRTSGPKKIPEYSKLGFFLTEAASVF